MNETDNPLYKFYGDGDLEIGREYPLERGSTKLIVLQDDQSGRPRSIAVGLTESDELEFARTRGFLLEIDGKRKPALIDSGTAQQSVIFMDLVQPWRQRVNVVAERTNDGASLRLERTFNFDSETR